MGNCVIKSMSNALNLYAIKMGKESISQSLIILGKDNWNTNSINMISKGQFPACWLFHFWYNFPPLSMRITSWIVKKSQPMLKKLSAKKVELQATISVHLVRSLINLRFSTNQIEETNKQIKLRWRKVDQSHGDAISMENSLELSTTLVCPYQEQRQLEQLPQQQQQQQINQQPQQCYLNKKQNCDDEDLDETNSKSHLSFPLLLHTFLRR